MNGFIVVNKSRGFTSHDVVNKIRKIFKTKRVGHLGTLDPLAEGVLVVCLNEATKLVQFLENDSKEYIAEIILGISTDTYDITGNIINEEVVNAITNEDIDKVLKQFLGKQSQIPPIYSAIKKDGKKLYEYAREGKEIKIEPRNIEIFNIERISDIIYNGNIAKFRIKTHVSKGTYIRSLCVDIATKLNTVGCMNSLFRTKSGKWSIEDAYSLDEIEKGEFNLYGMTESLTDFPKISDSDTVNKALHGMKISKSKVNEILGNLAPIITVVVEDKLVAIYQLDEELKCYKALRVWN